MRNFSMAINVYHAYVTTLTDSQLDAFKLTFIDSFNDVKCALNDRTRWTTAVDADSSGIVMCVEFSSNNLSTKDVIDEVQDALSNRSIQYFSIIVHNMTTGHVVADSGNIKRCTTK